MLQCLIHKQSDLEEYSFWLWSLLQADWKQRSTAPRQLESLHCQQMWAQLFTQHQGWNEHSSMGWHVFRAEQGIASVEIKLGVERTTLSVHRRTDHMFNRFNLFSPWYSSIATWLRYPDAAECRMKGVFQIRTNSCLQSITPCSSGLPCFRTVSSLWQTA